MNLSLTQENIAKIDADLLVILLPQERFEASNKTLAALIKKTGVELMAIAQQERFDASAGKTLLLRGLTKLGSSRLLLVGLGPEAKLTSRLVWEGAARAARQAKKIRAARIALLPPDDQSAEAVVSGVIHGAYDYKTFVSPSPDAFEGITEVQVLASKEQEKALERGRIVAEATNLTRDLVNAPPQALYPQTMADHAIAIAQRHGLDYTVIEEDELQKRGFNLLMAVGKGSDNPPRLIHLVYKPKKGKAAHKIALVGKGVTFDTGGYNIKPGDSMLTMHCDMAGGGAVLGAAEAIGALKPKGVEIHFVVPAAENSISGRAMRPNDIYRGYGGKTVEIGNTDAEGRLILADALAYAQEQGVDTIVDLATLTGACVVALGDYTSGLFTDDEGFLQELQQAIEVSGEDFWRLPLTKKLDALLDTPVADMKNVGTRAGGAITAALFLKRFINIERWAHLDIAAPAYFDSENDYQAARGTGFGVATLVALVEGLSKK